MDPAHIDVPPPRSAHNWQHLFGSGPSLVAARLLARSDHFLLYVARDTEDADRARREIDFFVAGADTPLAFPDWETLPYDNFSPHQDIISERLATLYALPRKERGVLVAPVQTLMQRLPPTAFVEAQSLVLETGGRFSIETQRARLQRAGYRNVGTVAERGEYAVRGSLMDIFPMGAELPLRIDLDDDLIDSLRTFDPDTQRTVERIDAVRILPAKEIPLDAAVALAAFASAGTIRSTSTCAAVRYTRMSATASRIPAWSATCRSSSKTRRHCSTTCRKERRSCWTTAVWRPPKGS